MAWCQIGERPGHCDDLSMPGYGQDGFVVVKREFQVVESEHGLAMEQANPPALGGLNNNNLKTIYC